MAAKAAANAVSAPPSAPATPEAAEALDTTVLSPPSSESAPLHSPTPRPLAAPPLSFADSEEGRAPCRAFPPAAAAEAGAAGGAGGCKDDKGTKEDRVAPTATPPPSSLPRLPLRACARYASSATGSQPSSTSSGVWKKAAVIVVMYTHGACASSESEAAKQAPRL